MQIRLKKLIILILPLFFVFMTACADTQGVNELRGQWVLNWTFEDGEPLEELRLFLNDFQPGQESNTYLAAGCMRSPASGAMMPVALNTIYDPADDTYSLSIYATFVPPEEEGPPWVIRFNGNFELNGRAVSDDRALGEFQSNPGAGTWQATHHDRRRTECPPVELVGERLDMDVYVNRDSPGGPERINLEGRGIAIVSSVLQITAPDGEVFNAPLYTDIFSPDVDFISEFRFSYGDDTSVMISDAPYEFVLLDVLGRPIPGTETQDIWTGCSSFAPTGLTVTPNPGARVDVVLSWTGVPEVTGEFEPGSHGFYQVEIQPTQGQPSEGFGSNWIGSTSHLIPWSPFITGNGGSDGTRTDGYNFGVSLSEFEDGEYNVFVKAVYHANLNHGGFGIECGLRNDTQDLTLIIENTGFIFVSPNQ
jgi:hypothetical protein